MLGNEMNDFDLQIRSMLEDAEVKPSRRVWKAVSSRIATGSKPSVASWGWMRWAGACAAFAALAVGVFLGLNRPGNVPDSASLLSDAAGRYAAALPVETTVETTAPVVPARPEAAPAVEPVPVAAVEPEPAAAPADVEPLAAVSEKHPGMSPEEKKEAAPAEPAVEDNKEYLPIEWEDSGSRVANKPLQLYAQGALLANESDINLSWSRAYMSSGADIVRTGVVELGDSSYGIPFSAGLGVRFYVLPRLAVGLGVNYSYLTRTFNGRYVNLPQNIDVTGSVSHAMQYIGIPVSLSYDFVAKRMFRFYGYGSAEAEYCLSNTYRINAPQTYDYSTAVQGLQWSVGAGVGVEFRFIDWLGIYLDPGIRYYFNCNHPTNIRTDKPLMVDFDLGVRFSF